MGRARSVWREFIEKWVRHHGNNWELADIHWIRYVHHWMRFSGYRSFQGAALTRRAEGRAQSMLVVRLAGGGSCKFCLAARGGDDERSEA